jgi:peptidoglycan/LPS O-acetylase OafA/YrhL
MPVIYWLRIQELFPPEPVPAMLAVLVPTFALAAISWYALERPVLRRAARRRAPREAPRRASREPAPARA